MSDHFERRVRDALRTEADAISAPAGDLAEVKRGASSAAPSRSGLVFGVAAGLLLLVVAGLGLTMLRDEPAGVVLQGPPGTATGGPSATPDDGQLPWEVPTSGPATIEHLFGRVFGSTGTLEGAPDPAGTITLEFLPEEQAPGEGTWLGVYNEPGCNRGGGRADVDASGRLALVDFHSTQALCEGTRGDLDGWVVELLQSGPLLEFTPGGFRLRAAGATVEFVDLPLQYCPVVGQEVVRQVLGPVSTVDVDAFFSGTPLLVDGAGVVLGEQTAFLVQTDCDLAPVRRDIADDLVLFAEDRFGGTPDGPARERIAAYFAAVIGQDDPDAGPRPSVAPGPALTITPAPNRTPSEDVPASTDFPTPDATPLPGGPPSAVEVTATPDPLGPDVDPVLKRRVIDDLRATVPDAVFLAGLPENEAGGVINGGSTNGGLISASLYESDFDIEVSRLIPETCPPITSTFIEGCGQVVAAGDSRIAIVIVADPYFHAFVDAPDGHVLNMVVQRPPGADSSEPFALSIDATIQWLSQVDALTNH